MPAMLTTACKIMYGNYVVIMLQDVSVTSAVMRAMQTTAQLLWLIVTPLTATHALVPIQAIVDLSSQQHSSQDFALFPLQATGLL